jgi:gliding motility-associated-like protein
MPTVKFLNPMKRILTYPMFVLFCFGYHLTKAQQPYKDCFGGIGVCNNTYNQAILPLGIGSVAELDNTNQGCLSGENNSAWYIINITSPGTLVFTISPVNTTEDYDFAVWDITGLGCQGVTDSLPIRCNYATNAASGPNGTTGLSITAPLPSYGAGGPGFSSAINALPGQTYAILVDNFSASTSGYTIDFSASVASIFDTVKPYFTNAGSYCGTVSDKLSVSMSEPIRCNSLTANGSDFYITPEVPGITITGASSTTCIGLATQFLNFDINFSNTLPAGTYYLHSKVGADANTLLDNCGNGQSTSDSIKFVMAPAGPPEVLRLDTPACSKATIILSKPIICATVAPDGSDFRLTGPSTVAIKSAVPRSCNSSGLSDTVDLVYDRSILLPGAYTLSVVQGTDGNAISDTCGNVLSKPYTYSISDQGYIAVTNANPLIVCTPGYITLNAAFSQPLTALRPSIRWTGPNLSDSTIQFPTAYIAANSTYVIEVMDTFLCYRRSKLDVIVPIGNAQLLSRDTAICLGDYVTLQISGGVDYSWYPSTGLSCTNCPNPIASPVVNTTYYGVVFDQYGCSDTISTTIKVNPLPIVVINAGRDTSITYAQSVQLYALSLGGKFFTWEPITGLNNANIPNPIATPSIKTTYIVYVTDTNQCRGSDSIDIDVARNIPVAIPSGFTPNGDGRNDKFRIINLTFQKVVEFRVYNRWGQEVFSSNDNEGWDGIYNGRLQDAGVYKYLIRVGYPDGHTENFKGDVTLIR